MTQAQTEWPFAVPPRRECAGRSAASARALLSIALAAAAGCRPGEPLPHAGFLDAPVAAVASQLAGRVESIPVHEGEHVQAGQLLAQLDAREREAAVAQARADLEQAKAALGEARANLEAALPSVRGAGADVARAQATLEEAQLNFARAQELATGEAASKQQLDAARARFREAQASLASLAASKGSAQGRVRALTAAVAHAGAAVGVSEAALELAQVQLAQAQVRCPFDAVVVDRDLEPGEWAAPGTPVVTVENLDRLWVRLDLEETKLEGLRLGDPARVTVLAVPGRTFSGHVIEVGAQGEFAVNRDVKRGRPDLRTFRVRVALDERSPELRPGMTAEVRPGTGPQRSTSPRAARAP